MMFSTAKYERAFAFHSISDIIRAEKRRSKHDPHLPRKERQYPFCVGESDQPDGTPDAGCAGA